MTDLPPPMPPPLPVEPLGYGMPHTYARPGILTAIGVLSIILGCFSGFFTCAGSLGSVQSTVTLPPPTTMPFGAYPLPLNLPDLMSPGARATVVSALSQRQPLTVSQSRMLDLMLRRHGPDLFTIADSRLSAESVLASLNETGTLPAGPGESPTVYFLLSTGRLEVSDDDAMFSPIGEPTVVVSDATESAGGDPAVAMPPGAVTGATTATVAMTAPMIAPAKQGALLSLVLLLCGNGLLGAWLLVCGILMLSNYRHARRLHWIYAWIKIPLSIAIAIPFAILGGALLGAVIGAVGLVYPVALLIVLRSPPIRAYYGDVQRRPAGA